VTAPQRTLDVIEIATGEVVKSVDVTGSSDRQVVKATAGMLRNMDTARFLVRDSADAAVPS
jgi:hypothetical protein